MLLVLILLLMTTLSFVPVWFAVSLLRFRLPSRLLMMFFFFQAEVGMRDHCVTGVQTCALPISSAAQRLHLIEAEQQRRGREVLHQTQDLPSAALLLGFDEVEPLGGGGVGIEPVLQFGEGLSSRSEERRVGKEGRSRWSPDH